jgi:ribose 5-phosphate isomerase A
VKEFMEEEIALYKKQAALRAVEFITSGMVIGLGFGSTAAFAVQAVGELIQAGKLRDIVAVLCSAEMEPEARRLGIPLTTMEDHPTIQLTIDGADEVDPQLNLIKGGGGALLREKIVAQASQREIIVVDETKLSSRLGIHHRVPVEVAPFGWKSQQLFLEAMGVRVVVRKAADGAFFLTDQKNLILDCDVGPIADPVELANVLSRRAGIVEHGLFMGLASDLIVAGKDGVRHITHESI